MIEQLLPLNVSQTGSIGLDLTNTPMAANANDVMKFNVALKDKKINDNTLLDVNTDLKANNGLLQVKKQEENNPIIKMDEAYHSILKQMKQTSKFDKFLDLAKKENLPVFRSNTVMIDTKVDTEKKVQRLLDETKEMYKVSGEITKDIGQWKMKTTIWSTNVKLLLGVVKQTSSAFKTLFHSAG